MYTLMRKRFKTKKEIDSIYANTNKSKEPFSEKIMTKSVVTLTENTKKDIEEIVKIKNIVDKYIPNDFLSKHPSIISISGRCRKKELLYLRHICTKIAYDNHFGITAIGIVLYRGDHSVVHRNSKSCMNLIETDEQFKELYLTILKEYNDSRIIEHTNSE